MNLISWKNKRIGLSQIWIGKQDFCNQPPEKLSSIPSRVDLSVDKINEWLKKGAQVSDRISRLLENLSVLEPKKRDNPKKGKKHKSTLERETAKSEKQSNNQEEISSEEKTNDAEESPDLKDVSEGA